MKLQINCEVKLRPIMSKKLRLISFWMEEKQDDRLHAAPNMWMKKSAASLDRDKKTRSHLESFLSQVKQTGVSPDGIVLCNCETTCSNDISLLYPWMHISDTLLDIKCWLRKQTHRQNGDIPTPPPPLLAGSLGRHGKLEATSAHNMRMVQGTYALVETIISERDIAPSGEQLVILIGFRTTNKVDPQEVWKKSRESNSWRSWTGISDLYKALSNQQYVEVKEVEFMESHTCITSDVFQYLVLLHVQVSNTRGKVGVLDAADRFRAGNMSGYVTVYCDLTTRFYELKVKLNNIL